MLKKGRAIRRIEFSPADSFSKARHSVDIDGSRKGRENMKDVKHEGAKVYIYTRVSTAMQVDGFSLDAQKTQTDFLISSLF